MLHNHTINQVWLIQIYKSNQFKVQYVYLFLAGLLFASLLGLQVKPVPTNILNRTAEVTMVEGQRMVYQPAVDAMTLNEFAPSQVVHEEVKISVGELAKVPIQTDKDMLLDFNGRVAIVIEPGTFVENTRLEFIQTTEANPLPDNVNVGIGGRNSQRLMEFQIEAVNEKDNKQINSFEKPARIVVDLRELTEDLNPVYRDFYLVYQDEQDPNVWHEVPSVIHQEDGLLSAEVTHFSNWAAGVRPERWNPVWTPPVVSEFSGAATYSHPIEVPPGRNGLQPSVVLSYSSRAIDGRIQDSEPGLIGDGWSLAEIKVVREGVKTEYSGGDAWTKHPDEFRLVFNGIGHKLIPDASASTTNDDTVRYYAEDMPGLFVERNFDELGPNAAGLYWIVMAPNGTHYRLGYTADAEEYQHVSHWAHIHIDGHDGVYTNANVDSGIAWYVDTVTDSFGNQMVYKYDNETIEDDIEWYDDQNNSTTFSLDTYTAKLENIQYNFSDRVQSLPVSDTVAQLDTVPNVQVGTRIEIKSANVTGVEKYTSIYVYHGFSTNPMSEYRIHTEGLEVASSGCINYSVQPNIARDSWTFVAHSIQQFAGTDNDPATLDNGVASLPITTFSYDYKPHFTKNNQPCFQFYYLTGYENGYGGAVAFDYISDNRSVGVYQFPNEQGHYDWPSFGYSYSVSQVTANDGINPDQVTTYQYTQPCYAQWDTQTLPVGGTNCAEPHSPYQYGSLVGYRTTTRTNLDFDATTILNKQVTTFSQDAVHSLGRAERIEAKDANNILLTKIVNTYAWDIFANNGGSSDDDAIFNFVQQTENYQFDDGIALSTKIKYEYDKNLQGNTQYGNLTHVKQYESATATTPYLTAVKNYSPITINGYWLVGLLTHSQVHDGDTTGSIILESNNYYDSLNRGALIWTESGLTGEIVGGSNNGLIASGQMGYDNFGNVITSTTPRNVLTTLTYDEDFALYPVKSVVSEGAGAEEIADQTTYFDIYGFKNANETLVPVDGFQVQAGLLKAVRVVVDANDSNRQLQTTYEYDPFGRLWATYGPGDSLGTLADQNDGEPINRYVYWDNSWNGQHTNWLDNGDPFMISTKIRPEIYNIDNGSGYEIKSQTYFDGFGRLIQEQTPWASVDGESSRRDLIVGTEYNALGQVVCATVPFDEPIYVDRVTDGSTGYIDVDCQSKPHTISTHDALGRVRFVTAPDGSFTQHVYLINEVNGSMMAHHNIIDANQRRVKHSYNSLGQLIFVDELTGNCANYWGYDCEAGERGWEDGAVTEYVYDVQGNLRQVLDANGNRTLMNYDVLGRKVYMDDPDMGVWHYFYDVSSNLLRQEANLNQDDGHLTCFYYDILNRLQRKVGYITQLGNLSTCPATVADAPSSGQNHLTSYEYDTAVNGLGHVAQVNWGESPLQNYETYSYDDEGRVIAQTRVLDGRAYSMSTLDFDSLNRPTQIQYPNDDVVTIGYDREGENSLSLENGPTLVTNVLYNERGQLTQFQRGNNANTHFQYFDANGNFRLQEQNHSLLGGDAFSFEYQYDLVGNIRGIQDTQISPPEVNVFVNDDLNRLVKAAFGERTVSDSFNNANNWNSSSWSVSNGVYRQTDANCTGCTAQLNAPGTTNLTDFMVRFRFKYNSTMADHATLNLAIRADGSVNNAVEIGVRPDNNGDNPSGIVPRSNGVYEDWLQSNPTTVPLNSWHDMQVQVVGKYVQLFLDGQLLAKAETTRLTPGNIFLKSVKASVEVDDFELYALDFDGDATQISYQYDALGNMSQRQVDGVVTSYDYPIGSNVDQPHAVTSLTGGSTGSFDYDAHGNMVERLFKGDFTQTFGAENRLVQVTDDTSGDVTYFTYDANGQRVKTEESDGTIIYYPFPGYEEELRPLAVQPSTVSLTADYETDLTIGQDSGFTLRWNSSYATSCSASGSWSGNKDLNGSLYISGFSSGGNRIYALTCSNASGDTQQAEVNVYVQYDPTLTFTVDYQTSVVILDDTTFTLRWDSTHATSCTPTGSWVNPTALDGSRVFQGFSNSTRQYHLTCSNLSGSITKSVSVTAVPANDLTWVPRYNSNGGPCVGKAPGTCTFDARPVYYDLSGNKVESINAYGKYWVFTNGVAGGSNGSNLTSVPRYIAADGPCYGRSGTNCAFQSRTVFYENGQKVESITAYGKTYAYFDGVAWSGNGMDLTAVARYNSNGGPCVGRSTGNCVFDTRIVYFEPDGDKIEGITAYGKYWVFTNGVAGGSNGSNLTSVSRYMGNGSVCYGRTGANCQFDTRTVFYEPNGDKIEAINAYGKYWVFTNEVLTSSVTNSLMFAESPSWEPTAVIAAPKATGLSRLGQPLYQYQTNGELIYVSMDMDGNVAGLAFTEEDILTYDTSSNVWALYFDASDVGVTRDLNAFHLLADGSLLLSLQGGMSLPGAGSVDDSDIVRFVPTSLGSNTAGTFEMYLDGSDVGLTTSGEDIDAISVLANGDILISTVAAYSVTGVSGGDEDLIRFSPTSLGTSSSGSFALYFDGSAVGLNNTNNEEIVGAWVDEATDDIYLTTLGDFSVSGLSGDGADVFVCAPDNGAKGEAACSYRPYWDGATAGVSGPKVDALFVAPEAPAAEVITIQRVTFSLAGQVVAVKVSGDPVAANNGLFYVYSDHLGSTSALSDANGNLVPGSLTRYLPFGEYRGAAPTQTLTDRDFTGQKENRELGLLYYNARYYVPGIGRFASADTIVPDLANPQSFNRFSYVNNNPIKFIDPSGHFTEQAIEQFLRANYDNWENVLTEWQNDKAWWEMVRFAQAGDVLLGKIQGDKFAATFVGISDAALSGIFYSDPSGNKIENGAMHMGLGMEELRNGRHVYPRYGITTGIDGIVRWNADRNQIMTIYGNHTQSIAPTGTWGDFVRTGIDVSFNFGIGVTLGLGVHFAAPAVPLLARIPDSAIKIGGPIAGEAIETIFGGGLSDWWITANGLGENQVKINFQSQWLVVDHQESQDTIVHWGPGH